MEQSKTCQSRLAIVLPSLDPDEKFLRVVDGLVGKGFEHIVVVNDGSSGERRVWFEKAAEYPQVHLCTHEVNRGKGRALKTAFEYVIKELPRLEGVITIDGDGQHLADDIIACGERMLSEGDKVVLGCRDFDVPGVPPRSVAGNKTTSRLFRLCYGIKLSDTQTGLRAIPARYLPAFCGIDGERFEYETNMLLNMKRMGIAFYEQPIATVYDPEDYSSHYDSVRDSWRIFKVMFKFMLSSVGTTILDLLVFYFMMRFFSAAMGDAAELVSSAVARVISSFVNFSANNAMVFKNTGNYKRALFRYYCLAVPQLLVSAGMVTLINGLLANSLPLVATVIKFCVDTVLFFISYQIQREWVFSQKD